MTAVCPALPAVSYSWILRLEKVWLDKLCVMLDIVPCQELFWSEPILFLFIEGFSLVQAAGRGGRNMGNGQRKRVLFYLLFNRNDIGNNVPGLSTEVREFCETKVCLKLYLQKYFGVTSPKFSDPSWCCSNCMM